MDQNLSLKEITYRYFIMMAIVITGGLLTNIWIMVAGIFIFFTCITAWCPLYSMLGINHADNPSGNGQSEAKE